jgi:hypothetical protein
MSEVRRQHGQAALDILSRSIPAHERLNGKSMSKIVQAWTVTRVEAPHAGLAGEFVEGSSDGRAI